MLHEKDRMDGPCHVVQDSHLDLEVACCLVPAEV